MAQPRRANRTPAAGRRPRIRSPAFGLCFACETRNPSFQACPLRVSWPNRPPVKGSSQAAPAGSQGATLSAFFGGMPNARAAGGLCRHKPPKRQTQCAAAAGCEGARDWRRLAIETPHGGSTRRAKARCPALAMGRPPETSNSSAHEP